jgi:membrane protease YdiL (CAAX protease family)
MMASAPPDGRPATGPASWPPTAPRQGVELSTAALLGLLLAVFLGYVLAFVATSGRPPSASTWPSGSPSEIVLRGLVLPGAIGLGIAVGLVVALGWRRAAGLGSGSASPWGTVPVAVFGLAGIVTLSLPGAVADRGFTALLATGLFLAALCEEVMFRGFLQHGLTRRLGGPAAVTLGSALFSAAHVPSLATAKAPAGEVAVTLVVLFGFGVVLCRIRTATRSVWCATGVHALWNFVTVGAVMWASSRERVTTAFGLAKLGLVVTGLVLAARLGSGGVRPSVVSDLPRTGLGDRVATPLPPAPVGPPTPVAPSAPTGATTAGLPPPPL